MTDRGERTDRSRGRQPTEGVRIIRAEEAQAALDAGAAAGRRPEDELRFGDVPPAPQGPRPQHRFPLPDSIDPAEAVALPPLASRRAAGTRYEPSEASWDPGDRTAELSLPDVPASSSGDPEEPSMPSRPSMSPPPPPPPPSDLPSEPAISLSGGADLPHWTDPPTGEVPRILADEGPAEEGAEDDLDAWRALGSRGIRWRDADDDWDDGTELADLADDSEPVGALDQNRSAESDIYSFDQDFERAEAARTGSTPTLGDFDDDLESEPRPAPVGARARASRTRAAHSGRRPAPSAPPPTRGVTAPPARDDMSSRVAVGIGLIVLLVIAYAIGPKALVVLAAVVIAAALAEACGMLQRAGFRPATLLGLVATVGLSLGAYWKGIEAVPLVLVLMFGGAMMWYVLGIVEARPLANVAVTVMVFVWVAVLGAFAPVMLRASHGKGLFLGAVLVAVAADVFAFLVGRWIGSRPMAASISPNKTVEGFIGGLIGALVVGAIVGKEITPWGGMRHGLVLGLIVGLVAPAGDLFESMMKRDLGIKDSGSILAGHGGLLDRFDAILVALPTAYYVAFSFHLVK
jgi:phosphatidate cytidylyltransferase